jgi:precorrin-2 dehydrogenase/sirohydrochlorin ferrochelatase
MQLAMSALISYSGERAAVSLFPIFLKLKAKTCVVIGAGKIAAAKAAGLLSGGARVVVIGPRAGAWIQAQARAGKVLWHRRRFVAADVEHAFLVVAATNSNATNEAVFRACLKRGVLCNVADDPQRCDFFYPAIVRRGPLQIAISTGGHSPALAHRLRMELEQQFGPEYGAWVEKVGQMRRKLLRRDLAPAERRKVLHQIASHESFERFVRQRGATRKHQPKE